ncbi:hypothetical protein AWB81_07101 [Caballeronia arationis]|uniref:hypothetical protein n=1 Tax=Caballeronia arationis TaxID=1777142 RepID=UPI00074BB786|nr:hypothetical protein [Caballeronia arationis]SAL05299.1 hypothetical protein AWB81_07101 [Caballeronia arationis]
MTAGEKETNSLERGHENMSADDRRGERYSQQPLQSNADQTLSTVEVLLKKSKKFLALLGLVLLAIAVIIGLVMPVGHAPFRMHASSAYVGLEINSEAHLSIAAAAWDAGVDFSRSEKALNEQSILMRSMSSAPHAKDLDMIDIWLDKGDLLLIKYFPGDPAQFAISVPKGRPALTVQLGSNAPLSTIDERGTRRSFSTTNRVLSGTLRDAANSGIRVSLGKKEQLVSNSFAVTLLGFGETSGRTVEPGLISGGIQFLDRPNEPLDLFRASDLRFRSVDADITAIIFSNEGIELFASGSVSGATLNVSSPSHENSSRAIMPNLFDRLKGDPLASTLISVGAGLAGLVSFVLSLTGLGDPLKRRILRLLEKSQ